MKFNILPSSQIIEKTISALNANGITAYFVNTPKEACNKTLEIIPQGAHIMTMTSVTLETLGLTKEINESGKFQSIRAEFAKMDQETQKTRMRELGAAPDWVIGSVHAITQQGEVLIASKTGSQLPAYAYGAGKVLWIAGAQKIVNNKEEGMKRIYEYTLPLESERAKKAYGAPGSDVDKMLIINREIQQGRITIILVNEVLGF